MAEIIKIGRNYNNKKLLTNPQDPTVSKLHLQLFVDDDYNVFVSDLKSANGTYVNHNRLTEPLLLEEGDMLSAGNCIVKWAAYINSLKNLDTKMDDKIIEEEIDDVNESVIKEEIKSGFFVKYFTYNNEYISGGKYFWRIFLQHFLIGLGLYLGAVTVYKRGRSLELSHDWSLTWAIFHPISFVIVFWIMIQIGYSGDESLWFIILLISLPHLYLLFSNGKELTVLEKKLNREIDLKKSNEIKSNDSWSREDRLAFYAALSELSGVDGIDPNEESIIASYLSAIGFNPTNNQEFELFRNEAIKIKKDYRYEILNSFSNSKKQLFADAIKHVILADEKISEEELLAKGLIEILADLPKSNFNQEDYDYFKNLK